MPFPFSSRIDSFKGLKPGITVASTQQTFGRTPTTQGISRSTSTSRRHALGSRETISRLFHNWWIELLAAVLVVLSFSGLISVLLQYQGKPLPNWPLNLSLNTALSVFGVLFRSPVLFIAGEGLGQLKWRWLSRQHPLSDLSTYDEASRGPWGSTKLLWTARWRDLFAFLGALITIGQLGMDPFTQAVVSYYGCSIKVDTSSSSIAHTNSILGRKLGYGLPTWARIALDVSLADPYSIKPDYSCAANTCNFEPYHSIGICSSCVDLTNELHTTCWPGDLGGCNHTLAQIGTIDPKFPNRRYDLNTTAGFLVQNSTVEGTGKEGQQYARWNVLTISRYAAELIRRESMPAPADQSTTFDIVSARPKLGCRCSFKYCIKTYTATIDRGVLNETLISTSGNWSLWSANTAVIGTVNVKCLESKVRNHLIDIGYLSTDVEWMAWNGTFLNGTEAQEGISNSNNLTIPVRCVYQAQFFSDILSWTTMESYSEPLEGSLIGTGLQGSVNDGIQPDVYQRGKLLDKTITLERKASNIQASLWNNATISFDSVDSAFHNFSSALTNYMRRTSQPIPKNITNLIPSNIRLNVTDNPVPGRLEDWNQPIGGEAFVETTCIAVRWPWLTLPASLFVGTIVFLIGIIIMTTLDGGGGVWKSSQNALIWHGLAGPAEGESDALVTTKEMNARAKSLKVRLNNTRRGWKLVQDG
ncbi:hypothetical protein GQ44DRAFT_713684 [Phaeosphaeriaceae sp. PMI808]|nr:hypothetical protein GQ44DRAFT_713684 [Phaeosphaeriaceae sp. PMI808]